MLMAGIDRAPVMPRYAAGIHLITDLNSATALPEIATIERACISLLYTPPPALNESVEPEVSRPGKFHQ